MKRMARWSVGKTCESLESPVAGNEKAGWELIGKPKRAALVASHVRLRQAVSPAELEQLGLSIGGCEPRQMSAW